MWQQKKLVIDFKGKLMRLLIALLLVSLATTARTKEIVTDYERFQLWTGLISRKKKLKSQLETACGQHGYMTRSVSAN